MHEREIGLHEREIHRRERAREDTSQMSSGMVGSVRNASEYTKHINFLLDQNAECFYVSDGNKAPSAILVPPQIRTRNKAYIVQCNQCFLLGMRCSVLATVLFDRVCDRLHLLRVVTSPDLVPYSMACLLLAAKSSTTHTLALADIVGTMPYYVRVPEDVCSPQQIHHAEMHVLSLLHWNININTPLDVLQSMLGFLEQAVSDKIENDAEVYVQMALLNTVPQVLEESEIILAAAACLLSFSKVENTSVQEALDISQDFTARFLPDRTDKEKVLACCHRIRALENTAFPIQHREATPQISDF